MFYILVVAGIILGVILGRSLPVIPYTYSLYLSVGILAALDSIFGAIASIIKKRFDFKVFITGLFGNSILTMLLTYLGTKLNIDIHIGVIIVFVGRMFNNLAIIRRHYIEIWHEKYESIKEHYLGVKTDKEFIYSNENDQK